MVGVERSGAKRGGGRYGAGRGIVWNVARHRGPLEALESPLEASKPALPDQQTATFQKCRIVSLSYSCISFKLHL